MQNIHRHENNIFIFPENLKYECVTCGKCCLRDWQIYIDPKSYFNLKDTELIRELKEKHNTEEIFHLDLEKRECTITKFNGRCPMMQENNLCIIHSQMGFDEKPVPCRYFPHILAPTPEGIYVGLSFNCNGVTLSEKPYQPHPEEIPQLLQILEDSSDCQCGYGDITIFDDIITDWKGYGIIEKYILDTLDKTENIADRLSVILLNLLTLTHFLKKMSRNRITAQELAAYLKQPFTPPFGRDEDYKHQEFFYSMFLVTILETEDTAKRQDNLNALLNKGTLYLKTFKTEVNTQELETTINSREQEKDKPELLEYIKHLVWRKELLKMSSIGTGLAVLSLVKTIYDWYYNASAFVNSRTPHNEDRLLAQKEVEGVIKHDTNHIANKYAKDLAASIYSQMTLFLDQEENTPPTS